MAQAQYAPKVEEVRVIKEEQITLTLSVVEAACLHELLYRFVIGNDDGIRGVLSNNIDRAIINALPVEVFRALNETTIPFVVHEGARVEFDRYSLDNLKRVINRS